MKTKTNRTHEALISWVKKNIKYQTPLVLLFVALFAIHSHASSGVIINEIMFDPDGSDTGKEWLEIYNSSESDIDLAGWKFFESGVNHGTTIISGSNFLPSGGYAVIAENAEKFLAEHKEYDGTLLDSSFSLSNDGESITIKNKAGTVVDEVTYSKSSGGTDNDYSIEIKNGKWSQSNVSGGTPGEKNSEEKPNKNICKDGIYFNEIGPVGTEFLELINAGSEACSLAGWSVTDAVGFDPKDEKLKIKDWSYHRTVFLPGQIIEPKEFFVVEGDFSLNNDDDTVKLSNADKIIVQEVSYTNADEGKTYNFDGKDWRWSKFITKGEKNVLNNQPYGTLKVDESIFVKTYADFFVSTHDTDGDKIKITWDFGDGHKSYLQKTRHKYDKTGEYSASVKLYDGSEDIIKKFTVKVKNYPHPKVQIISIKPNPAGKDAKLETITVKNRSGKKINLIGWSVATGTKKKLTNHPISKDVIIAKGKTKTITRSASKFTLNNKKAKIELRYPDGEVASQMKYDHGKTSIADDEIYTKVKEGWEWKNVPKPITQNIETGIQDPKPEAYNLEPKIENVEDISDEEVGKQNLIDRKNILLQKDKIAKIELSNSGPRVLGASTVREVDGEYVFTPQTPEQDYYLITFFKNLFLAINSKINTLLNFQR